MTKQYQQQYWNRELKESLNSMMMMMMVWVMTVVSLQGFCSLTGHDHKGEKLLSFSLSTTQQEVLTQG